MRGGSAGGYLNHLWHDFLFRAVVVGTLVIVAAVFATRPTYEPRKEHGSQGQPHYETGAKIEGHGFLGIGSDAWTAIFTGVLTLFTGVLAVTAFVQIRYLIRADETARINADAARRAAEVAERTLVASSRAWIKVGTPTTEDNLAVNENGILSVFHIPMENIGKEPALSINPQLWITFFTANGFDERTFSDSCEVFRKTGGLELSLFPGEKYMGDNSEYGYFANATRVEMEQSLIPAHVPILQVMLAGCITYRFPSDPITRHQTRFAYRIWTPQRITLDPVDVPASTIKLTKFDFGGAFHAD